MVDIKIRRKKLPLHYLQLYNLRPLMDSNTLLEAEKNQIWIPSVTFVNTATQVVKEI